MKSVKRRFDMFSRDVSTTCHRVYPEQFVASYADEMYMLEPWNMCDFIKYAIYDARMVPDAEVDNISRG